MKQLSTRTWLALFLSPIAFFFLINLSVSAEQETNCAVVHILSEDELHYCKDEINYDIEQKKEEYRKTAETNAMYREMLESGEARIRSLNEANNDNRTRLRVIDRRLASFQSPPQTAE